MDIQVDGGINPSTVSTVVAAGANVLVAGVGIYRAPDHDYAGAIQALRAAAVDAEMQSRRQRPAALSLAHDTRRFRERCRRSWWCLVWSRSPDAAEKRSLPPRPGPPARPGRPAPLQERARVAPPRRERQAAGSGGTGMPGAGSGGTGSGGTGGGGGGTVAGAGGNGGGRGGATGAAGTTGTGGAAGSGGAGGAGGSGGAAGRAGSGGVGGAGGSGGTAGTTGAGGSAGASGCTITAASSLSTAIPTVGIVTFTTNLAGITGAQIRFGLASTGPTMTAPVDLAEPGYRTLLLGMKTSRAYVFRIVLTSGAGTCTSQDYPITTGVLPSPISRLATTIVDPAAHAPGFIIVGNGANHVYIVDAADGEPVWGTYVRANPSRAHMSWDGRDMYTVSQNASVNVTTGNLIKMSMDGAIVEDRLSGIATAAHHDFAVIPGGVAALQWLRAGDTANAVVERATDGTLTTVVADLAAVYQGNSVSGFHPNSIHYHPWDDSYTIGDAFPKLYVKITRKGELVWQFGGSAPKDPTKHFQVAWSEKTTVTICSPTARFCSSTISRPPAPSDSIPRA